MKISLTRDYISFISILPLQKHKIFPTHVLSGNNQTSHNKLPPDTIQVPRHRLRSQFQSLFFLHSNQHHTYLLVISHPTQFFKLGSRKLSHMIPYHTQLISQTPETTFDTMKIHCSWIQDSLINPINLYLLSSRRITETETYMCSPNQSSICTTLQLYHTHGTHSTTQ